MESKFTMDQPISEVRLTNLRLLHGRAPGFGAPTSALLVDHLTKNGVSITTQAISDIYAKKQFIGDKLAGEIEAVFDLPSGWLSADHEFLYALNSADAMALQRLVLLSPEIKGNIAALIMSIPNKAA